MNRLRIAIIGCGRISHKHVEALVNNKDEALLVSLCDIIEEKSLKRKSEYLSQMVEQLTINCYTDYKEMVENEKIDVCIISTESGYHADIAIYCMNKGKHVVVEKPMALSIKDAEAMINSAKVKNVKLCVCHQNRFNASIQQLRKAIEEGRFGKLINGTARILWNRDMNYYKQATWRGKWKLDGGTLLNQCIHDIDLLQWMLGGEVEIVFSQMDTFIRDIEGEDFGAVILRFKNGAIGIIEGSACVFPKNLEETLSVFGESGTAVIGGLAVNRIQVWRFNDNKDSEEEILKMQGEDPTSVYGSGHSALLKDFIQALLQNREPRINGEEGKKALEIILAAYKSRLTGQVVKLPLENFSTLDMVGKGD